MIKKFIFISSLTLSFILISCNTQAKEDNVSKLKKEEIVLQKGYEVYQNVCSSCHILKVDREKIREIRRMVMMGKKPPLKAPPMNEVSARLKFFFKDEESFKEFVKDYITNPSREKGKCMPMAFKMFGVMPPIGKGLTEEQKEAVSTWLYRAFNDKWEDFHRGGRCKMMKR